MHHQLANKSILITGCNGFLGKRLLNQLVGQLENLSSQGLSQNHSIIAIDNCITSGKIINSFPEYVKIYEENALTFDYSTLKSVDLVFHLAGLASPAQYKRYPLETIDVAVILTRSLLDLSLRCKSRFIYFSSSEIYGNPDVLSIPTPESYKGFVSCIGPRSCYDESKRLGETLCYVYSSDYGVDTVTIRPFNIYGPGMSQYDYRMIPNLLRSIIKREVLQIYGEGNQTRTFCYVDDAINGILLASLKGKPGSVYNIGNVSPEISMVGLVKVAEEALQVRIPFELVAYPDNYPGDEPMRRCPDLSRASSELGYSPLVSLNDGLIKSYKWALDAYKK